MTATQFFSVVRRKKLPKTEQDDIMNLTFNLFVCCQTFDCQ